MAKNFVQAGDILDLEIADISSGDPVCVGEIVGVALTDTDADGKVRVKRSGVFELSVKAVDSAGNSAVAVGDAIYYVDGDDPPLSKKDSGVLFGYALETITGGQTATIQVALALK